MLEAEKRLPSDCLEAGESTEHCVSYLPPTHPQLFPFFPLITEL